MANGHGGKRTPRDPAPVSGPGALSARTDGGPGQPVRVAPGGEYGSRQEMEAIQGGAVMADGGQQQPAPRPTPLGAPTARPEEPITAGVDVGPGMDSVAAGIQTPYEITNEKLRPILHSLETMANLSSSNPEFRTFVRNMKARLSQ